MVIDERTILFLQENKSLIQSRNYTELYEEFTPEYRVHEVTSILYESGIDPLKYMNVVPKYFFAFMRLATGDIVIPDGITEIKSSAFACSQGIDSITIPNSITTFGSCCFQEFSGLNNTIFKGTKAQWKSIYKESNWNFNKDNCIVHCVDGDTEI